MCFGCGVENPAGLRLRFFSQGNAAARCEVTLGDMHQGYPGIAHGGIVMTILDEALGRAALSADPKRLLYSGKVEVRFRQPVPLHKPLTVLSRIDKDRGRLVLASAELLLPDGTVAAEATGTLFEIPPETLREMDTPEVGWQVYPLE